MGTWYRSITKLTGRSTVAALGITALFSGCGSGVEDATPPVIEEAALAAERYDWEKLSPDVADFIKSNYLSHKAEFPDADEPRSALKAFVDGQELLEAGSVEAAVSLFTEAVAVAPRSRHAQAGLGRALLRRYAQTNAREDLEKAANALVEAHRLALQNNRIRYTDEVAQALGELKDTARLARVFQSLAARAPSSWLVSLDYAKGLDRAGSPEAETWLKRSAQARPDETPEPAIEYAKWLLARERAAEAFVVLEPRPGENYSIVHFFRGHAAEKVGDEGLARQEYQQAVGYSELFHLPDAYRTELAAQVGVKFEDHIRPQHHCAGHTKMSEILYCEARGEGVGGMRAVGWTIRSRVFLGTEKTGCTISNSGATTCEKYYSVAMQSGQFYKCGTRSSTSDSIAYDVYYGVVPDPYARWCPAGSAASTSWCSTTCSSSAISGANANGGTFFYATSGTCSTTHPSGCGSTPAKTCGNGGGDHCFYRVP
jgi:tetratricopeptide (TPR) repeat protein